MGVTRVGDRGQGRVAPLWYSLYMDENSTPQEKPKKPFDPFREQRRLMRQNRDPQDWGGEDKSDWWMAGG